jgi:hypothetical protein
MNSNQILQTLSNNKQNVYSLDIDVFDKAIDTNDIEKSIKKQIEHLDLENQLKELIQNKLECSYVKGLIVNNFEQFINDKIINSHYHSKDSQTNYIKSVSIFYRHGLSKIISKMMEDFNNDSALLSFFLEEIIKIILEIEDKLFIGFINEYLSTNKTDMTINEDFIFEIMNDEKTEKYLRENSNPEKINRLLLDIYSKTEFNSLINNPEYKITDEEKKKWIEYYNNITIIKDIKEEEYKKKELSMIKDLGITKGLNLLENAISNTTKTKSTAVVTQYISKNTNGGKRYTKKNTK